MNTLDLISVPFYEFTADEQLTNDVLEDVKKLKFDVITDVVGNSTSYDGNFYYHPKLFDFFDSCLLEIKNKLQLNSNLELPIVSCWANKNSKFQYHYLHNHPNSIVSGIFYLTTHDGSDTIFMFDNPWYKNLGPDGLFLSTNHMPQLSGKNKPVKGKLLIFPSFIKHKVSALTKNETRYTISFNTYISGVLGDSDHSLYLDLKAKSVREIIENERTKTRS